MKFLFQNLLIGENPEDEVKTLVFKQCNDYLNSLPKELHDTLDRDLPTQPKHLGISLLVVQKLIKKSRIP